MDKATKIMKVENLAKVLADQTCPPLLVPPITKVSSEQQAESCHETTVQKSQVGRLWRLVREGHVQGTTTSKGRRCDEDDSD